MATVEITLLGRFDVAVDGVRWPRRAGRVARLRRSSSCSPSPPAGACTASRSSTCSGPTTPRRGAAEAAQGRALRPARLGEPDAVVLRGDQVALLPGPERRRRRAVRGARPPALADEDVAAARARARALRRRAAARGPLRGLGRGAPRAARLRHLDLLRLDGAGRRVIELDPGDEARPRRTMRRHAAVGDRHAALRQFERLDRALRHELGVAPGREALALRDRLLAEHEPRRRRPDALVGRDREQAVVEQPAR